MWFPPRACVEGSLPHFLFFPWDRGKAGLELRVWCRRVCLFRRLFCVVSAQSGDFSGLLQKTIWPLISLMHPCYATIFSILQMTSCVRRQVVFPSRHETRDKRSLLFSHRAELKSPNPSVYTDIPVVTESPSRINICRSPPLLSPSVFPSLLCSLLSSILCCETGH